MAVMLLLVGLVAGGLIRFQHFKAGIIKQIVTTIRPQQPTVATAQASMQEWQPHRPRWVPRAPPMVPIWRPRSAA